MLEIIRKRYVIVREDNCIFCGFRGNFEFKPIDSIGNASVKTYLSVKKAKADFIQAWYVDADDFDTGYYKVVEVIESLKETI